jgi:hypothetical protein
MRKLEPRSIKFRNQLPSNGRFERTCGEAIFPSPFGLDLKDFAAENKIVADAIIVPM